MRRAEDPNTQRDREREREQEIPTIATCFKEKGEKPVTPLSSQKPKNQNHILPPKTLKPKIQFRERYNVES